MTSDNGDGGIRGEAVQQNDIEPPDLGHLVVILLAGTLSGVRDRLHKDGFARAGMFIGVLCDMTDAWLAEEVSKQSGT